MKIRNGFVSNSSSSSFCIYGVCVDKDQLKQLFNAQSNSDLYEVLDEKIGELKLDLEINRPPNDLYYIGISHTDIGDDETGAQFKGRVEKQCKLLLGDLAKDFDIHEDSWYDG